MEGLHLKSWSVEEVACSAPGCNGGIIPAKNMGHGSENVTTVTLKVGRFRRFGGGFVQEQE